MSFSNQELSDIYLRSQIDFTRPNVNSEHFGISSLRYMSAKVSNGTYDETRKILLEAFVKSNLDTAY